MDETTSLEALAGLLETLAANPYDVDAHAQHIALAKAAGMADQARAARDMFTAFWAAGEDVWTDALEEKAKEADLASVEGVKELLELYEKAERDYLSLRILEKHAQFLVDLYETVSSPEADESELKALFKKEWMHDELAKVARKASLHLTQGHRVWTILYDWQTEALQSASPDERSSLVARVEKVFLERLQEPHSDNDNTFQNYSSFTTAYKPPGEYEALLVSASKLRGGALKVYARREKDETLVVQNQNSLDSYASYIAAEKRTQRPHILVLRGAYERAIAIAAHRRFGGDQTAEAMLHVLWAGLLDSLRRDGSPASLEQETFSRALRSVPGSGEVWARYIRFLERQEPKDEDEVIDEHTPAPNESIADAYTRALGSGLIQKDVEQIVPLVLARLSYIRRTLDQGDGLEAAFVVLLEVLENGIAMVGQAAPTGDPRYRLEKYAAEIYTTLAQSPESAAAVWEGATKRNKTSYVAWSQYAEALGKQGDYDRARATYRDIAAKNLDWSEALWESWLAFEHLHGSVTDLEDCMDRIERAQITVQTRRAKEAERAYQAMQIDGGQAHYGATTALTEATTEAAEQQVNQLITDAVSMDVDAGPTSGGTKRKAEDDADEGHKRVRTEPAPPPLKRDRENCTVFVSDLPADASEDDLSALFKDCGPLREVKVITIPGATVASVEFMARDSVPQALTKDKKRVKGVEIAVHLAWQSTLYVTNFPEGTDDAVVRELFGKYGTIFEVRWPSKKFKNSRRFCYVQYTAPAGARAATELHNVELEPGMPLSVLISNPERKKERTDANANDREIYVAGLNRSTTQKDLERLFSTYGTVKEVRLATDKDGKTKGFAFIEFEQEKDALAALSANNYELKGRRIAVTLADTRARPAKGDGSNSGLGRKAEIRNRSVRVRGIPLGTQEGLLQQFFEKHATIKRVELFADVSEAIVELESAAEAGKLLLSHEREPLAFDGRVLQLSEESAERAPPGVKAPSVKTLGGGKQSGLLVPRTAGSRPRAGLGKPRAAGTAASVSSSAPSFVAASSSANADTTKKGQDDFRKMLSKGNE